MSFFSVPYRPIRARATEQQIEAIYEAAGLGLVGDELAHKLRMSPSEYRVLREQDPMVEAAEEVGRADKHAKIAEHLHSWAASGDKAAVKACIAILQNKHGWITKTQVDVSVDERISVTVALDRARQRVIDAEFTEVSSDDGTPLTAMQRAARRLPALIEADEDDE